MMTGMDEVVIWMGQDGQGQGQRFMSNERKL